MSKLGCSVLTLWGAGVMMTLGCGADAPLHYDDAHESAETESQLSLGVSGEAVSQLQQYFSTYGYFPNEELLSEFPAWRPVAETTPVPGVFDEITERAVLAFQRNFGLPQTGVVDAPTQELINTPRCGVPDNTARLDASNKFHLVNKLTDTNITWRLTNTDDGITQANARAAVSSAVQTWRDATLLTFTQDNGAGAVDIALTFVNSLPGGLIARCSTGALPKTCQFSKAYTWSIGAVAGAYDLQSVATHELGHALGFEHSGFTAATMYPFSTLASTAARSLDSDDIVAARAQYKGWESVGSGATDVGASTTSRWMIGTVAAPGGKEIFKYELGVAPGWVKDTTGSGTRISVDSSGRPWTTTAVNLVYRRKSSSITNTSGWDLMPDSGTDIGASPGASSIAVWKIGTASTPGGYDIAKWNPATNAWDADASGGGGVRIAVDNGGFPWVVNSAGLIYKRPSTDPASTSDWVLQGGGALAYDISVADPRYPMVVSRTAAPGGYRILVRNAQPGIAGDDASDATERDAWVWLSSGTGTQIAAWQNNAQATVVTSVNLIYTTR